MADIYLEYCMDGYHLIRTNIDSYEALTVQLEQIKAEAAGLFQAIFCVDLVIGNAGRMSIGLDDRSMLAYTSQDFEENRTSLGDKFARGETIFFAGDYSLMSDKYIISYDKAMQVVKSWMDEGKISNIIEWTDELF
ncbi:MAG: hypothetical protein K2O34_00985 [Acetatifactor sp.]|nr:hypothetical protein [Acetatifactor sp.]